MRRTVSISIVLFALAFPSACVASPDPNGFGYDLDQLSSEVSSNSSMSNWGSLSSATQGEIERAIAGYNVLAQEYGNVTLSPSFPPGSGWSGFDSAAWTAEQSDATTLTGAYNSITVGGSVEEAIGGGVSAVGSAAGWAGVAGLVPLAGRLTYEDLSSGSNFITRALFSGTEDNSKVESEGGVGAEAIDWVLVPPGTATANEFFNRWREAAVSKLGSSVNCCGDFHGTGFNGGSSGLYSASPGLETYVLTPKAEGHYWSNVASYFGELKFEESRLVNWPFINAPKPFGFLAGWPVHLLHVATTLWINPEIKYYKKNCGTECFNEVPQGESEFGSSSITSIRYPSRMHFGVPRKITKTEHEKLSSESRIAEKREPKFPATTPELNTSVKKVAEECKVGGCKNLEKWLCHYLECETKSTPSEPETPKDEPQPAKPENSTPQLPGIATVPNCGSEVSGVTCQMEIEAAGFTNVELDPVYWEAADLSKPANAWLETVPSPGSKVETTEKIQVRDNPSEMPVLVPNRLTTTETGTEYQKRLEKEGWTKVTVKTLPEVDIDPSVGPEVLSYTSPGEETRQRNKETPITVEQNPATAPAPSGGKVSGPTLPGFKFPNFAVLCKGFPFGVPCWLAKTIESWSATPEAPNWGFENLEIHGHHITGKFNLSHLEPLMEVIRPVMLLFATIGLVLLFYNFAKGGGPPSGGGQDNSTPTGGTWSEAGMEQGGSEGF